MQCLQETDFIRGSSVLLHVFDSLPVIFKNPGGLVDMELDGRLWVSVWSVVELLPP